jgi:signal transduction histidine kinase
MGFKMASEREKMITSVSHDIRTPVTAIKGYVQGIRDGVASSDEKRDEYLRIIYEKTIDIEDMIKDLREISTLEMTKNNYNYQKININDFIRDFSEEMSFDIENINGKVISEFISEDTYVMVDPVKLRRVFMNIYENSKKYRSEKDLIIRVNEYKENDYVMIDITDNGIGIKAKDTKLVFDRFFRGDRSRNTDIPGSGLGLSICKEIMDNHEGGISIRSKKKEGTTVTVSLRIWDGE